MNEKDEMMDSEATEAIGPAERAGVEEADDGSHQIIINLSDDAFQKLKGTADRSDSSVAELVKNGLALADWLEEESSRGGKVLIQHGDRLREFKLGGKDDE